MKKIILIIFLLAWAGLNFAQLNTPTGSLGNKRGYSNSPVSSFGLAPPIQAYVYHADTKAYKDTLNANGGTILEADLQEIDKFIRTIDSADIRKKIFRLNFFAGNDLTSALVPFYKSFKDSAVIGNRIDVNNNFVSGDYTRTAGLGNLSNTNKYLSTGISFSTVAGITVTNFSWGFYQLTNGQYNAGICLSSKYEAGKLNYLWTNYTGGLTYLDIMQNGEVSKAFAGGTNGRGLWIDARSATGAVKWFNGADLGLPASTAGTKPAGDTFIFCFNNNGTPGVYCNIKGAGYFMAQNLTDAEKTIITNAWNRLITALGR